MSNRGQRPPESRELSQYQPGRLYAREDGGGSRRAEGALYLAAAWLRSKGAKVTPRCGTEERSFAPLTLGLFVFLSFCLLVPLSPLLSFFNTHPVQPANYLKTKDLRKRHF